MPTIRGDVDELLANWTAKGLIAPLTHTRMRTAPAVQPDNGDEKGFMADVVAFARRRGWKAFHVHDARKSESGWPDCVFLRDRLIVAELKVGDNEPTPEQLEWLEAFRAAGIEAFVWYPADWPAIEATLR